MSLRAKILLLFFGFALLPVLLLGAGDYLQSVDALRAVIEARGEALATQAAGELEREYADATSSLRSVAERVALQQARGSAIALDGPPPAPFSSIILELPGRKARVLFEGGGSVGIDSGCPAEPRELRIAVALPGAAAGARLEGVVAMSRLLDGAPSLAAHVGQLGFSRLVERSSGRPLYTSDCARVEGLPWPPFVPGALDPLVERRTVAYHWPGEGTWRASAAVAPGPGWLVTVHSSDEEFVGPFRQSRMFYIGLALLVLSAAALFFSVLAQNSFRSLGALAAAADAVRLGNLNPWLPPPGDDEVGRLTLAFRKMMDRLDDSIRQSELNQKMAAVGELASYLSHEIRNPLSSIRLSLQSLRRSLDRGRLPEDAPRILEIALSEVNRLDGVVRTVLEMGRPAGRGRAGACSVHDNLGEALQVLGPKMTARGVDVQLARGAEPDRVFCDPESLRGVWINLLVNALDALQDRPEPRVRISTWTDSGNGEVVVRMADNGPGVPPGLARSIFEPFFTTKPRGNGIGLSMAVRVLQRFGGGIACEPVAAGTGAAFVIRLQLAASDAPAAEAATTEETPVLAGAR